MPEGPEVRRVADVLKKAVGSKVSGMSWSQDPSYKWGRYGINNANKISGTLTKVSVKGKLICVDFDNGYSFLNTLGMTGTWAWSSIRTPKYARVYLNFNNKPPLVYCDQRNFGTIKIVDWPTARSKINSIGWDLLQSPMPMDKWIGLRSHPKFKNFAIGVALLEQKWFSGIGNIYKSEVLYRLGINPKMSVGSLSILQWGCVNLVSHLLMQQAYQVGGCSVDTFSADGKDGSFQNQLLIYRKVMCPGGHTVSALKQNKRTTWYCPQCQN